VSRARVSSERRDVWIDVDRPRWASAIAPDFVPHIEEYWLQIASGLPWPASNSLIAWRYRRMSADSDCDLQRVTVQVEFAADSTPAEIFADATPADPGFWLCFAPLPVLTYVKYAP